MVRFIPKLLYPQGTLGNGTYTRPGELEHVPSEMCNAWMIKRYSSDTFLGGSKENHERPVSTAEGNCCLNQVMYK
jgi:hypothetical protein